MTQEQKDARLTSLLADFDAAINSRIPGDFWATWQNDKAVMEWIAKREDAAHNAAVRKCAETAEASDVGMTATVDEQSILKNLIQP